MAVGKGGMFFTFTAFMILALVFAQIFYQAEKNPGEEAMHVASKVSTLNAFVNGFETDVERGFFIITFRALLAASSHISDTGIFLDDSNARLHEAVINGSFNSTYSLAMENSTLGDWLASLQSEASKLGVRLNFSYSGFNVSQVSPWIVGFSFNVSYNLTDFTNTASFKRSLIVRSNISIINLEDPVYRLNTNGQIIRKINQTPYEEDYVSGLDVSNLIAHIDGRFYTNSSGPSFLMRLEGNLSDSEFGIESFVVLTEHADQELPVYERSAVDYIYFNATPVPFYTINNTYEGWFRLDGGHLDKYQASDIAK